MGRYNDEGSALWPSMAVFAVLGFLFSFFNWLGANDHFWIWFGIAATIGVILIFLGKTKELSWVDVGFTVGILVGLLVGHCFA